jgi:glycosyltransferase involved in cell wall biosynthesis
MNDIVVTIVCIAYNQEKYISETIESFLMQKTNFNYEILIQDDASKDKTPEIIKKYEMQYPDIIRPVYQKENQYSKGIQVLDFYQDIAKGKYIAVCEGDDYWTDPNKLQRQVDYMEKNQDCSACVHAGSVYVCLSH